MHQQQIDAAYIDGVILPRHAQSNKETYGRVLMLCGSVGYTGAAYLSAQAAVRTGSGVVMLCVPQSIYPILATKLNEAIVYPIATEQEGMFTAQGAAHALTRFEKKAALLIGCGLGRSLQVTQAVHFAVTHATCPMVIDADGIYALKGHIDILRSAKAPVILTPHLGELKQLLQKPDATEQDAAHLATQMGVIVLLKGHRSVIFTPSGACFRNITGNPGMAKGGSGDVLSGMIVSLCGQGLEAIDAACAGAYLHGKAGDICANTLGEYGMTPSDMLEEIPLLLRRYNTREW